MDKEEANKILAEKLFGKCWHEWKQVMLGYVCVKCKGQNPNRWNNNYFSEEGFFEVLNKAKEQEWWEKFVFNHGESFHWKHYLPVSYIDPNILPMKVAEFLKEGVKG